MDAIQLEREKVKEFKEQWEEHYPFLELEIDYAQILQYVDSSTNILAAINKAADHLLSVTDINDFL